MTEIRTFIRVSGWNRQQAGSRLSEVPPIFVWANQNAGKKLVSCPGRAGRCQSLDLLCLIVFTCAAFLLIIIIFNQMGVRINKSILFKNQLKDGFIKAKRFFLM